MYTNSFNASTSECLKNVLLIRDGPYSHGGVETAEKSSTCYLSVTHNNICFWQEVNNAGLSFMISDSS